MSRVWERTGSLKAYTFYCISSASPSTMYATFEQDFLIREYRIFSRCSENFQASLKLTSCNKILIRSHQRCFYYHIFNNFFSIQITFRKHNNLETIIAYDAIRARINLCETKKNWLLRYNSRDCGTLTSCTHLWKFACYGIMRDLRRSAGVPPTEDSCRD